MYVLLHVFESGRYFLINGSYAFIVLTFSNCEKKVKWVILGLAGCTHFLLQEILMKS